MYSKVCFVGLSPNVQPTFADDINMTAVTVVAEFNDVIIVIQIHLVVSMKSNVCYNTEKDIM